MRTTHDDERDLRLELMRLDHKLKLQDLRRLDRQLAYGPVKFMLLAGGCVAALGAVLLSGLACG